MRTNETYILVPKSTNVDDIFLEKNKIYRFKQKSTGKYYDIRLTIGREQRIVGLGEFYRDNNAHAGSKVTLERRVYDSTNIDYLIDIITNEDSLVLQHQSTYGFRVLRGDQQIDLMAKKSYETYYSSNYLPITLNYSKTVKPRKNSPDEYKYYDLFIGDQKVNSNYPNGTIIELVFEGNSCRIIEERLYQKIIIERI